MPDHPVLLRFQRDIALLSSTTPGNSYYSIIIVIQIDAAIECGAMALAAIVALHTTVALSATVAVGRLCWTAREFTIKSEEIGKNLRPEVGAIA